MQIVNDRIKEDLQLGKPIRLNLGSGPIPRPKYYSVDQLELPDIDIVANLNEPLDLLPDNCADSVFSRHALEHVHNLLSLMREIYRITAPDGHIELVVPHFSNPYFYSDPTHVRFFGLYSMNYFVAPDKQNGPHKVPAFYSDVRFIIESINIEFYNTSLADRLISPLLSKVINKTITLQDFYERRLSSIFHAWQIRYIIRPDK